MPLIAGQQAASTSIPSTIGEMYASDATVQGSLTYAAGVVSISNGSTVKAGAHTAGIRLTRGGELQVCPGTSLSLNSSAGGNELMLAMGTGALEADYPLPASADVIMTPDLRILLSGPGQARIFLTSNARGDTCVRSIGEGSYVIVTEAMGDQTYRVKPNEQVFFPGARIDQATGDIIGVSCGCPKPTAVKRAELNTEKPKPAAAATVAAPAPRAGPSRSNPESPLPPDRPGQVNVQVDAPFVFRGSETESDITLTLARVHMERLPWPPIPAVNALPPRSPNRLDPTTRATEPPERPKSKGFFRRIGGFFAAIFRG